MISVASSAKATAKDSVCRAMLRSVIPMKTLDVTSPETALGPSAESGFLRKKFN